MKKTAYIWTREFTRERLQKICELQRVWEKLFGEPGDRGHYGRFQWLGFGRDNYYKGGSFNAPLDGKEFQVHLQVLTTREWFARKVYLQAIAQTKIRYPRFDERLFFDGPRIGERIVEFISEEHDLAWGHLWTSLRSIIQEEKPTVSEAIIVEECSTWGYPAQIAKTKRFGNEFTGNDRRITLVRHTGEIDEDQFSSVKALIQSGKLPDINLEPVAFTFDEIRDGFIELSSPELVLLNWSDARPAYSDEDLQLIECVTNLDVEGIELALLAGANPNTINLNNKPLISSLIGHWNEHDAHFNAPDEDLPYWGGERPSHKIQNNEVLVGIKLLLDHGAHPDLHGPGETTAITDASINRWFDVVELLLRQGANAAIECYFDYYPGEWPQAWDSPHFFAFHENVTGAKRIYDLLIINRPSPIFDKDFETRDKNAALGIGPNDQSGNFLPPDNREDALQNTLNATEDNSNFEYKPQARPLPNNVQIQCWLNDRGGTALAAACIRYAMAFNTSDASWLDGIFAETITYDSQSVLENLNGRKRVMLHLLAKLSSIKCMPNSKPLFELGLQLGEPCVIGYQSQGAEDQKWLVQPVANFTFDVGLDGLIKSIHVITVAPAPTSAQRSAIYPGLEHSLAPAHTQFEVGKKFKLEPPC